MKQFILAHDIGTTGNKATLYDREGRLMGSAFYGYDTAYSYTGWAEQNPEDWWRAVCATTNQLLRQTSGVRADQVACIVFSGQMMGCVPLDRSARPLRNALIWADTRSLAQERWVGERIAPERVYHITGHRLSASYSLTKMLWLRDHEPETYRSTYKFVHAKDAIAARLTGRFVTDPSDASSMNLFDIEAGTWSNEIIQATGVNPEQLPPVIRSIDFVGEIQPDAAAEVGLSAGTPVVIGGGDGPCAAVGAGVIREGVAYNYIGSSSWIALASPKPVYDPELKTFTFGHVIPGMVTPTGTMQAAGASYQWTRDQLGMLEQQAASALGISAYELLNLSAEKSPAGANGLVYLPYLLGERSPRWNPQARGAFIGLTIRHTRADMVRAVLEGITLNLRVILDALTRQGAQIDTMRVIGGGARGRFWNQLMADIYGVPVQRLAILEEATSMGAAVIGGVAVGLYSGFDVVEQMNPVIQVIEPNNAVQPVYESALRVFEAAYQALVPVYELMADSS